MSAHFTAAEVATALNVSAPVPGDLVYPAVSTDTRAMTPGALFVALKGDHFDGHDHLRAARDAGAGAAVVRRETPPTSGLPYFEVDDPLMALGALAAAHRRRFKGPVIAITGQNGKTSTKEMVAAVMGTRWRTHKTRGNNNNMVGVPLTVLQAPDDTEAMVIEAGANMPGEIAHFREILAPDIAVVTSIGAGHLEGFGSVAGVLREKLSLTVGAPLAIVAKDPPELAEGARARANRVVVTGLYHTEMCPLLFVFEADGMHTVHRDGQHFRLAARGMHQIGNAMIAWAIAHEYQLDLAACARALERFTLPPGRGEMTRHGNLLILNDSYNANPESFKALVEMVPGLGGNRRLIFVAGSMRELGEHSADLHAKVARQLFDLQPDVLALVGDFVPAFAPMRNDYLGKVIEAPDADTMGPLLAAELKGDEFVVLKGSRGVTLERIIPFLITRANG